MLRRTPTLRASATTTASLLILLSLADCGDDNYDPRTDAGGDECKYGKTECGTECVDITSHPDNCGACGKICRIEEVCSLGSCEVACDVGLENCNRACVNQRANNEHCGGCGLECEAGNVCYSSECALSCPAGLEQCGQLTCFNTSTDTNNCGACGNTCEAGHLCYGGDCILSCPPNLDQCGQLTCFDTSTDADNCGACGTTCETGHLCYMGECLVSCPPGLDQCGHQTCLNLASDVDNCGACGLECRAGEVCRLGECVLSCPSDLQQCGQTCCGLTEVCVKDICAPRCDEGEVCGSGMVCNSDNKCADGCFIDNANYAHGDENPLNPCEICAVSNETAWTVNVGAACGDGLVCNVGGQCVEGCFIDNANYAHGDENPLNPCEMCAASNQSEWTVNVGAACGAGLVCNEDGVCASRYCHIDGVYYPDSYRNPDNLCKACLAENENSWTNLSDGTQCGSRHVCSGGACYEGCFIDGSYYELGTQNPLHPCLACTVSSTTDWTSATAGITCGVGRVCNASAVCIDGCHIDGVSYLHGDLNPMNRYEACTAPNTTGWTVIMRPCGASGEIVIAEVYGGGGTSTALYRSDYVVLLNRGKTSVNLLGLSLQYASTAGFFGNTMFTDLPDYELAQGAYYLVEMASGSSGALLPTADHHGTFLMHQSAGKIALVRSKLLNCGNSSTNQCPWTDIVDFVGFGSDTTQYEGSGPTATLSTSTAAIRKGDGYVDTDDNASDFLVGTPSPRNTSSPTVDCVDDPGSGGTGG